MTQTSVQIKKEYKFDVNDIINDPEEDKFNVTSDFKNIPNVHDIKQFQQILPYCEKLSVENIKFYILKELPIFLLRCIDELKYSCCRIHFYHTFKYNDGLCLTLNENYDIYIKLKHLSSEEKEECYQVYYNIFSLFLKSICNKGYIIKQLDAKNKNHRLIDLNNLQNVDDLLSSTFTILV